MWPVLLLAPLGVSEVGCSRSVAPIAPGLVLEATRRWYLPDHLSLRGAALRSNQSVVVWADTAVLRLDDAGVHPIGCPDGPLWPIGIQLVEDDSAMVVVDSVRRAIVHVNEAGCRAVRLPRIVGFGDTMQPAAAAGTGGEWIVSFEGNQHLLLVGFSGAGREEWRSADFQDSTGGWGPGRVLLKHAAGAVVVAGMGEPFPWVQIGSRRAGVRTAGSVAVGEGPLFGLGAVEALRGWVGLGVFPVYDGGFLQILADPRSDRRRLVMYDRLGTGRRVTTLRAAFGGLGVDHTGRWLATVLRTDSLEVVVYRVEAAGGDR